MNQQYKPQDLSHKSFVYMEIQKDVYGISQAGKFSKYQMEQHLVKFGYEPAPINPG